MTESTGNTKRMIQMMPNQVIDKQFDTAVVAQDNQVQCAMAMIRLDHERCARAFCMF